MNQSTSKNQVLPRLCPGLAAVSLRQFAYSPRLVRLFAVLTAAHQLQRSGALDEAKRLPFVITHTVITGSSFIEGKRLLFGLD